jgi:hypothetical protein
MYCIIMWIDDEINRRAGLGRPGSHSNLAVTLPL